MQINKCQNWNLLHSLLSMAHNFYAIEGGGKDAGQPAPLGAPPWSGDNPRVHHRHVDRAVQDRVRRWHHPHSRRGLCHGWIQPVWPDQGEQGTQTKAKLKLKNALRSSLPTPTPLWNVRIQSTGTSSLKTLPWVLLEIYQSFNSTINLQGSLFEEDHLRHATKACTSWQQLVI